MSRIMVTPEELSRLSAEFDMAASSVLENVLSIKNLTAQLNGSWEGEISTAYTQKIETEIQHSENLSQILLALSDELRRVSQSYQLCESDLTSKIADLFG